MVVKGVALVVALAFIVSMIAYVVPFLSGNQTPTGTQPSGSDQQTQARAQQLKAQLARNPKDFPTARELGDLYWDAGASSLQSRDASKAADYFLQATGAYGTALKIDPKDTNVRTDMATAYYYSGNAARALKELAVVLKANPKHGNALFNLGLISKSTGNVAAAKAAWQKYLQVEPNGDRANQVRQDLAQLK